MSPIRVHIKISGGYLLHKQVGRSSTVQGSSACWSVVDERCPACKSPHWMLLSCFLFKQFSFVQCRKQRWCSVKKVLMLLWLIGVCMRCNYNSSDLSRIWFPLTNNLWLFRGFISGGICFQVKALWRDFFACLFATTVILWDGLWLCRKSFELQGDFRRGIMS